MANNNKFEAFGNPFMSILSQANDLHRSASVKHGELLDLLKEKNVLFKDIQIHLFNQAKQCHLYKKDLWNAKKNCMDYRSIAEVKCYSWCNAILVFVSWAKSNYKDYGVKVNRVARKNDKPALAPAPVVIRREIKIVPQELQAAGPSNPDADIPNSAAPAKAPAAPAKAPAAPAKVTTGITAPVTTELTLIQKQTVIFSNLSILGQKAKELGALEEFNMLMDAMGLVHEMLPEVEMVA